MSFIHCCLFFGLLFLLSVGHTVFSLRIQPLQVHPTAAPTIWARASSSACLGRRVCSPVHVLQVLSLTVTTGPALPTSPMSSSPLCLLSKASVWKGPITLRPWCLWLVEVRDSYILSTTVWSIGSIYLTKISNVHGNCVWRNKYGH